MIIIDDIFVWICIVFVLVLFVLCIWITIDSVPILTEGIVTAMEYEPARKTFYFQKIGDVCRMVPIEDDEDWVLTVHGTTQSGKERTENWEVSREQYEQTKVGDIVTR